MALFNRRLFGLLFILVAVHGHPQPQGEDQDKDSGQTTSTDKCNEFQFQEFVFDQVQCFNEAVRLVDEAIAAEAPISGIKRAVCQSISGKVDCVVNNSGRCYNEEQQKNLRINFLDKEFEKAYNNSDLFGLEFVESCPVLKANEDELVREITGSNTCTYFEFQASLETLKKCKQTASKAQDAKLILLIFVNDKLNLFTSAWCNLKTDYTACRLDYNTCLSPEIQNKIKTNDEVFFEEIEDIIRQKSLPEFSFDVNCAN